jgi:uncharacterized membrane protein
MGPPPGVIKEQITVSQYVGPLPDPHTLARYNEVLPSAAERILAMAEREQAHRHSLDERALKGGQLLAFVGQTFALAIGFGGIAAGFVLVLKDKPAGGLGTVITSLVGLVGIYIWNLSRRTGNGERVSPSKTGVQAQPSASK